LAVKNQKNIYADSKNMNVMCMLSY